MFGVLITGCEAPGLPIPVNTPLPTYTAAFTSTPAPMPLPTAAFTPTPTPTPVLPNTAVFDLGEGVSLLVSPEQPIVGREVAFTLTGLSSWETVEVTFSDPYGEIVGWIEDAEYTYVPGPYTVYADRTGTASWSRYGIQDVEGTWRVNLDFDSRKKSVPYKLEELKLRGLEWFYLGPRMSGLIGPDAGVFFSDDVPAALATDIQARLALASVEMEQAIGIPLGPVPDVYLVGGQATLDLLSRATLVNIGWEGGYYRSQGFKPGIYINSDRLRADLESILVHEYLHHVNQELVGRKQIHALPRWLDEGISEFYMYELGLKQPRPDAFKMPMISSADNAKSAALSGSLFPLSSLESGVEWNNRTDPEKVDLQYDQAYMVIRFMIETFGISSPFDVLQEIANGADLPVALKMATNSTYEDFESRFVVWLSSWDDSERSKSDEYFQIIDRLLARSQAINDQRNEFLNSGSAGRFEAYTEWVQDAESIVGEITTISPPDTLQNIHADAVGYFGLMVLWLELGRSNSVDAANGLIPELSTRDNLLYKSLATSKFVQNLPNSSLAYVASP